MKKLFSILFVLLLGTFIAHAADTHRIRIKVLPEDAIYIGDSKTDIATAENAGIDCVIVKWGYGNEKDWQNEYILESVDDMCEIPKYF